MIALDKQYIVYDNFQYPSAKKMLAKDIVSTYQDYRLDERLGIISYNNTFDLKQYLFYMGTFAEMNYSANSSLSSAGLFVAYLNMGLIPAIAPPSFMHKSISEMLMPFFDKLAYKFPFRDPARRLDGTIFDPSLTDIWVRKIEVADRHGISVDDVNLMTILKGV